MRHSLPSRPRTTTARRAACTAGSMTLTAALLLGAAPTAQAASLATASGTAVGSVGTTAVTPADLAADTFARTVTGGWGTATTGGAWTTSGASTMYAVANGAGTHRVATGVTSAVYLNDVESTDTDTRVDVAFDRKAGSGAAAYASILGRSVKGASDYRTRLMVNWAGTLELHVSRGGTLLAKTPLTDVLYGANVQTTVRMQVTGTSPTTVRAKAWRAGTEEPAGWQVTTTDADPAMQAPGRLGLSTYASGATAVASYSDLHVTPTVLPNVLPTASFTARADDLAVALDASASSDPDGAVAGYAWDHGDGTTGSGRTASHTYAAAGTYPVTLTVTDSRGGTDTTTRTVTAVAPNVDPLARFAAAVDDLAVVLDASSSSDSDGTITALTWDHGDGTTSTGTSSTHLYAAPGTYPVTLTVTDDRGGRSTTTRTVTAIAPNVLPTAGFSADVEDLQLAVDAASSSDHDGTLESYRWTFGDGTASTSPTATHTYAVPGDYPVTLSVTDDRGGVATTTRTVTAIAPNVLPTARFAPVADDLTVTLDGSASTDSDGTLRTLFWDFGDGTVLTGATARHTYAAPGTYPVTLTVTDDRGGLGTVTRTVTAVAPNVAPTARLTAAATDLTVALDASGSADPDGSITSVRWDHGDGTSSAGTTARHTYAAAGDYSVTVTVTDDRGGSATASRTVSVLAPNVAPLAALTAEATDLRVALDGTTSTDPDGSVASYAWDLGDGSTATGATTAYTYPAAGTYTVTLTVTDDRGGSAVTTRTVTAVAPRLAALHPFASSSVWNTGLGSEARLEAKTDPRTANLLTATPTINRSQWSIPVFQAKSTDVLGTLYSVRDKKTFTFRIPADATGATGSGGMADGHGTIIQPDGVTSYDTYKLVKTGPTDVGGPEHPGHRPARDGHRRGRAGGRGAGARRPGPGARAAGQAHRPRPGGRRPEQRPEDRVRLPREVPGLRRRDGVCRSGPDGVAHRAAADGRHQQAAAQPRGPGARPGAAELRRVRRRPGRHRRALLRGRVRRHRDHADGDRLEAPLQGDARGHQLQRREHRRRRDAVRRAARVGELTLSSLRARHTRRAARPGRRTGVRRPSAFPGGVASSDVLRSPGPGARRRREGDPVRPGGGHPADQRRTGQGGEGHPGGPAVVRPGVDDAQALEVGRDGRVRGEVLVDRAADASVGERDDAVLGRRRRLPAVEGGQVDRVGGLEGQLVREGQQPLLLEVHAGRRHDGGHEQQGERAEGDRQERDAPGVGPAGGSTPAARWSGGHGVTRKVSTGATWVALTGIASGTTDCTNAGTAGRTTSNATRTTTSLPGVRQGVVEQERSRAPAASTSSNPWSSRAIRTDATARAGAPSTVADVVYDRPASRAAPSAAKVAAWSRPRTRTR